MKTSFQLTAAVAASALLAVPAQADLITPVSVIGSSQKSTTYKVSNIANGTGLSSAGDTNNYNNWSLDTGTSQAGSNVAWQADGSNSTHWAIINLGAAYNLETITFWNLNPDTTSSTYTGRQVKTLNVWYSTTGAGALNVQNGDGDFNSTGYTSLSTAFGLSKNPGAATEPITTPNGVITGITGVEAQWVAIEITDSWGSANVDKKASLTEVQFFGTPVPVPEPSSLALLAAGGLMMIKRRRCD